MKIDLDKFQILYYLEGCARGSHLRQDCWHQMINLYPDTPTDECAAYLGRTTIAARRCAGKMRLKKSPQFMATVRYGAEFWERGRQ